MPILSEEEKEEILRLAHSAELREDMERLREFRRQRDAELSLDDYLRFLADMQALFGHSNRPFRPITGDHFVL